MAQGTAQELTIDQAMAGLPPDFQFFANRFTSVIQPKLAAREGDRVAAIKKQQMFTLYGVLAFAALGAGGWFIFREWFGFLIGGFAGFGLWAWGSMAINKLAINRFLGLGLVPRWDRAKYEDLLSGARDQAPFQFFEAHLEERRTTTDSKGRTRTTWVTVFKGQCLTVKFHKEFQGITKVYRDMGAFNWLAKFGVKEPRVRLEDPVFEKAFEVYGSDQIEARFILTPDFMERLLGLERTFQGKQLRCAFAGGEMLLCVAGKNLLEPGSMHRKMDDLNRVREILLDFAAIFLLIDAMCKRLTPDALRNPAS
jgi:hypothetical protein